MNAVFNSAVGATICMAAFLIIRYFVFYFGRKSLDRKEEEFFNDRLFPKTGANYEDGTPVVGSDILEKGAPQVWADTIERLTDNGKWTVLQPIPIKVRFSGMFYEAFVPDTVILSATSNSYNGAKYSLRARIASMMPGAYPTQYMRKYIKPTNLDII
jgi:hypothetical protein